MTTSDHCKETSQLSDVAVTGDKWAVNKSTSQTV